MVFAFGLLFGSLANVILLRFNTGESLVWGGSRCFGCARRLGWYELIPIFSFLFLRAQCRTCKSKISWQYPLVELGTGLLFIAIYSALNFQFPNNFSNLNFRYLILNTEYLMLIVGAWYFLWLSALYDFRHKVLPDFFNYSALVLAVLATVVWQISLSGFPPLITDYWLLLTKLLVSAALFLFFFSLWFLSKGRWMGLGDAKFVLPFGFLMSPSQALLAVVLAFWIGAVVGILLVIFSKLSKSDSHSKRKLWESDFHINFHIKAEIPFGPFLFLGAILSFALGEKIINWYVQVS